MGKQEILRDVRAADAICERSNEALRRSGGNPTTQWLGNVLHINDVTWFQVAVTDNMGKYGVHTNVGWIASVRFMYDEGGEFDWADTVQEAYDQSNGGM